MTNAVQEQVLAMLNLQHSMNTLVHAEWVKQSYPWYRAAWLESAELLDHVGWKWWKHQEADREQVILELVDIWHFALSDVLQASAADHPDSSTSHFESCARLIHQHLDSHRKLDSGGDLNKLKAGIESFAGACLHTKRVDLATLLQLCDLASLEFDELYRKYIGKNVLNRFRQDHGYKDGSYIKIWGELGEDNEVLATLVNSLDTRNADFKEQVYSGLSRYYPKNACS